MSLADWKTLLQSEISEACGFQTTAVGTVMLLFTDAHDCLIFTVYSTFLPRDAMLARY